MQSALTPAYLFHSLSEAQRVVSERQPQLQDAITRLEKEVTAKEASVRELLRLIQKQGLSLILEQEYQQANNAWLTASTQLSALRKEAKEAQAPALSESDILAYLADVRATLQSGDIRTRQTLLRQFVRSIVLHENHIEVEYTFGLSTLAPISGFGGFDSPLQGAPTAARTPVYGSGGHRSVH